MQCSVQMLATVLLGESQIANACKCVCFGGGLWLYKLLLKLQYFVNLVL